MVRNYSLLRFATVWMVLIAGSAHVAHAQAIDSLIQGTQRVLGSSPSLETVPPPASAEPQYSLPVNPPIAEGPIEVKETDGLVSLSVRDASLRQVLSALAQTQGINIIVAAPADVPVSAEFKRMPLEEVLASLLTSTGHTWTVQRGVIVVTSLAAGGDLAPEVQGRRIAVIELDFASAADLHPAVEGLLSNVGQSYFVETDPTDNRRTKEMLVVEDIDPYVTRIEQYLAEADQAPRQVLIEVNLLQVSLDDNQRCGVDFKALSRLSGGSISLRSSGFTSAETTQDGFTRGTASPGFFVEATGGDLDNVIEALISTTDAKSLASPRLLALNGQESHIQIGERLGYRLTTTTQTSSLESIEFLDVGVVLRLKPRITRDGRVLLQVAPKVSTGSVNSSTGVPDEETTELTTDVLLQSGQGMIIGGLIQEIDSKQINRIPILGSLPYVNGLFQRRQVDKGRSELIVALVPHIMPFADPAVVDRTQHDLMRAQERLTYGPLCKTPRPYEPSLADPYTKQERLPLSRFRR